MKRVRGGMVVVLAIAACFADTGGDLTTSTGGSTSSDATTGDPGVTDPGPTSGGSTCAGACGGTTTDDPTTGVGEVGTATDGTTGAPSGGFAEPQVVKLPGAHALVAADLDGDGDDELAITNAQEARLDVLRGGDLAVVSHEANTASAIASGDVDGDGAPDLVLGVNGVKGQIQPVLSRDADLLFGTPIDLNGGCTAPVSLAVAPLDDDVLADVVAACAGFSDVAILRAIGDGDLGQAQYYGLGDPPGAIGLADVADSPALDLVYVEPAQGHLHIRPGLGGFMFDNNDALKHEIASPASLAIGELDGADLADIAVVAVDDCQLRLAGSNPVLTPLACGKDGRAIAAGDLDDDEVVDLVTAHPGELRVARGLGNAEFAAPVVLATMVMPIDLALGDFDGDGLTDLAVSGQDTVLVFLQQPG